MSRIKSVGILAGALFAFVSLTASAFGSINLPDLSVTLGGTYPVHYISVQPAIRIALGTASGIVIEGTGATLLLLTTELSALGTFTVDYANMHAPNEPAVQCNSEGDAKGVVLMHGEFHLVPFSLAPLLLGILYLVTTFIIKCENGLEVLVRGQYVTRANNLGEEPAELTGLTDEISGKEGKEEISEYYNSGGTKIKAKLETEEGAGFVATDENESEEADLSVLGSQMFVITNR
jgi:hypothetical protein